jgi:hypothetical protein
MRKDQGTTRTRNKFQGLPDTIRMRQDNEAGKVCDQLSITNS